MSCFKNTIKFFLVAILLLQITYPCLAATKKHTIHPTNKHHKHSSHTTPKLVDHHTTDDIIPLDPPLEPLIGLSAADETIEPEHSFDSLDPKIDLSASIEQRLVKFVHMTVNNQQYSAYKLGGTKFDASNGIYVLDCSNYVDHVLEEVSPRAYSSLVTSTGADKPNSKNYYNFFTRLSHKSRGAWNKIENVSQLRPGDILVFRYISSLRHRAAGGHVMIVMNKPIRETNTYLVRIADAAPSGHSEDTRLPHDSGIGIGTMLLKVNPSTGQPFAYAWKLGSRWKKNVTFAMARPVDVNNL